MKNLHGDGTLTVSEFARLMGVKYQTVAYWLEKGIVPGAFQQGDGKITIKRWRIPKSALTMQRPRRGPSPGPHKDKVRRVTKAQQIEALQADVELLTKQRDDFRRLYEDVLEQMNHKNEELKALAEEVRSLKEELSLWHEKMKSISTQSTG